MNDEPDHGNILLDAFSVVSNRGEHYGPPWEHHERTATILEAMFDGDYELGHAVDVQFFFIADKLARLAYARMQQLDVELWRDHLLDIAGYCNCMWDTLNQPDDDDDGGEDEALDPEPAPEDALA